MNLKTEKLKNLKTSLAFCFFVFLFFCFFVFLFAQKVRAQTFSLSISPPLLEVMIMPGKSVSQNYELVNSGDQTEITAQIIPFEPEGEQGNVSLRGLTSEEVRPQQGWFSFENTDLSLGKPFFLKTGETKQIILKIKIPPDAQEDDYYFSLLFASLPQERLGFSGTTQAGVIGTNILITVSKTGQPVKKGEIIEFKLLNCYIAKLLPFCLTDSFQRLNFLLRIKNTGRTFWKPLGKIKSEGLLGQKWEQELQPENILANSIRQINVATPSASPSFLIGPYRAKVEFGLEEDGQGRTLSAATSFLALPIKAGLALLTGLVLLFMIKSIVKKNK